LRGKPWSIDEERQLRKFIEDGKGIKTISQEMGKTPISVSLKVYRLGLRVEDEGTKFFAQPIASSSPSSSSPAPTPVYAAPVNIAIVNSHQVKDKETKEVITVDLKINTTDPLPSVEEKLRVADAALVALETPGLSMSEISRLDRLIQGIKVYEKLFANFVKYSMSEEEVLELRRQLAAERNKN
jgi:hypothetical protein